MSKLWGFLVKFYQINTNEYLVTIIQIRLSDVCIALQIVMNIKGIFSKHYLNTGTNLFTFAAVTLHPQHCCIDCGFLCFYLLSFNFTLTLSPFQLLVCLYFAFLNLEILENEAKPSCNQEFHIFYGKETMICTSSTTLIQCNQQVITRSVSRRK